MQYLAQFPEKSELLARYLSVFAQGNDLPCTEDEETASVLHTYAEYYRTVFYLRQDKEDAAAALKNNLAHLLPAGSTAQLEEQLADFFEAKGLHFLGGQTSGYYGPYIWRTTEQVTYQVELPGGVQPYTVCLLDGFLARSWLAYLSFGEIGTGGWADEDGTIHCVRESYDLDSEAFRVSLLKHEAQHVQDLARDPSMSGTVLEYRAKLVELIYTTERNLLQSFARQADSADPHNSHAAAAARILAEFEKENPDFSRKITELPIPIVQETARRLFSES